MSSFGQTFNQKHLLYLRQAIKPLDFGASNFSLAWYKFPSLIGANDFCVAFRTLFSDPAQHHLPR